MQDKLSIIPPLFDHAFVTLERELLRPKSLLFSVEVLRLE